MSQFTPYSMRNRPPPESLTHAISEHVRTRILLTLGHITAEAHHRRIDRILTEVQSQCYMAYGALCWREGMPDADDEYAIREHFMACPPEKVLDFLGFFFRAPNYRFKQKGVDAVNGIFREEAVGYEFTPWSEVMVVRDGEPNPFADALSFETISFPEAMKKTNEVMQAAVITPALNLLAGEKWKSANEHMHTAHRHHRAGNLREAISECNSSLESFCKVICQANGWEYNPDRDVLSRLVKTMKANGLIDDFYEDVINDSGTIRNRLGGHGKEPTPTYEVREEHVEHLLNVNSSHMLLLAKLAGI